jgi:hypothetical protein
MVQRPEARKEPAVTINRAVESDVLGFGKLYSILWNALEIEQSGLIVRKLLCLLYIPILIRTSDQVNIHRICNQEGQGTAACKIVSSGTLAHILAAALKVLKLQGICCVPLTPELVTANSKPLS